MIFSSYIDCGNCGPTAGSGRCIPCERESQLEYLEYFGAAEAAAATSASTNRSALQSIALGVGTGLTVWAITRFLDRHFLKRTR